MNLPAGLPTVGIDLGGTNLRIGVVDRAGAIQAIEQQSAPTNPEQLVEVIARQIDAYARAGPIGAVGVGVAGMIDRDGTVRYAPNLPMLTGVSLQPRLSQRLAYPVVVDNDANAAAWGESCHGAAQGEETVLVITLGTGVGGGIISGGSLYRGAHGFAAEVGHWQFDPSGPRCACGGRGHWETMASGSALGRMAQERAAAGTAAGLLDRAHGKAEALTGQHVTQALADGDAVATELFAEFTRIVGIGLAGLINIFDPALVIISGGLVTLGEVLIDPIRRVVADEIEGSQYRPPVPILPAELGDSAGLVGAAAMARDLIK